MKITSNYYILKKDMITQALTGILLATLSLSAATATYAAQCPLIPDGNATLEESERAALLS